MSLATLQAKWDSFMTNKFTLLQNRQNLYFTNKGKYFQGIFTNAIPTDPNELTPDLTVKPLNQAESWADIGITLPATMPVRLSIDTYDGPNGHGWDLRAWVIVGSNTYSICVNGAGNETWRSLSWKQIS
jgi:hypothetical protein